MSGISVANTGIQVHGGMGFIEETGAAQFLRDVRVTAIYEGTNGIQAMDLVGRKLMDGGEAAFALLEEIETQAEASRGRFPEHGGAVWQAPNPARGDGMDGAKRMCTSALPVGLPISWRGAVFWAGICICVGVGGHKGGGH